MEPVTLQSFLEISSDEGSLGLIGEAVRLAPSDHRARLVAARQLAQRGRKDAAVAAFLVAAELVAARGYSLAALAFAKEALTVSPRHAGVLAFLAKLHANIAGRSGAKKGQVPPPTVPPAVDPKHPDAVMAITDEAKLLDRVAELAAAPVATSAHAEPSGVSMFSELTVEAFVPLVEAMELRQLEPMEELVEQGAVGSALFLVVSGELEVIRKGPSGAGLGGTDGPVVLATLEPGALVGEMALITEQPRSASVIAKSAVEAMCIERSHVEAVAREHPAITQELVDFARRRLLRNLLATSPLFTSLDANERLQVLRGFRPKVVPEGAEIITRGTAPTGLFVIAMGAVKVTTTDADGDALELATLGDGEVLGEIGLLEGGLTTATAVAARKTVLLHLPRESFAAFVARPPIAAYLSSLSADRKQANERAVAGEVFDAEDLVVI